MPKADLSIFLLSSVKCLICHALSFQFIGQYSLRTEEPFRCAEITQVYMERENDNPGQLPIDIVFQKNLVSFFKNKTPIFFLHAFEVFSENNN